MKLKKIYLPRIFIVLCLLLAAAQIIDMFEIVAGHGIVTLFGLVIYGSAIVVYLILLGFSFSSIGKNSPLGLLAVSLVPLIAYCWFFLW